MFKGFPCVSGKAPGKGRLAFGDWGRASYQIGDDPKSFLSGHSIVPSISLGIFCEITSVVAMPTALVDLPASELSGDISAKARESHYEHYCTHLLCSPW